MKFLIQDISQNQAILTELGITTFFELLDRHTLAVIQKEFRKDNPEIDMITYFYEQFLKAYNFQEKTRRGVFHTPRPIVDFIVRSTDYLLRTELKRLEGLADPQVQILDPATGTGIFLESSINKIKSIFDEHHKDQSGEELSRLWKIYIPKHLINKLFGFELLFTPFSLTHLKLGLLLTEMGSDFPTNQRLKIYQTNALIGGDSSISPSDLKNFSREDVLVSDIKTTSTIPVIIGNPPYSRSSKNTSPYIEHLMDSYKHAVRDEKNIQPLSDDYIKFIRLAQEFIERTGWGIVGMITNHTYLTGIIHRGMRQELMEVFDSIYILNLHGNKIIDENIPEGMKDENVFDIKQGICIAFFIKNPKAKRKKIFHYDLFGTKETKFNWLSKTDFSTVPWTDLSNLTPGAPFIDPIDLPMDSEYHSFHGLAELFDFYNVGGKPGDDKLLINFERHDVRKKIQGFIKQIKKNKDIGKLTEAKQKLLRVLNDFSIDPSKFEKYNYRPFDIRWTYYDPSIWTRPVKELKQHCQNIPLLLCSRIVKDNQFSHVFVTNLFTDVIFLSNTSSVNCYVFPLKKKQQNGEVVWNLSPLYLKYLSSMGFDPHNLISLAPIAYLYAILFSNTYRSKYLPFLKRDFPRIPFIKDRVIYTQLVDLGKNLTQLHLDPESKEIQPQFKTNVIETDLIMKGFPKYKNGKIFISSNKWFSGISQQEWEFTIGKYQVCKKWLKDRVERTMSAEDIMWYLRILSNIKESLRIVKEIDATINL